MQSGDYRDINSIVYMILCQLLEPKLHALSYELGVATLRECGKKRLICRPSHGPNANRQLSVTLVTIHQNILPCLYAKARLGAHQRTIATPDMQRARSNRVFSPLLRLSSDKSGAFKMVFY